MNHAATDRKLAVAWVFAGYVASTSQYLVRKNHSELKIRAPPNHSFQWNIP